MRLPPLRSGTVDRFLIDENWKSAAILTIPVPFVAWNVNGLALVSEWTCRALFKMPVIDGPTDCDTRRPRTGGGRDPVCDWKHARANEGGATRFRRDREAAFDGLGALFDNRISCLA